MTSTPFTIGETVIDRDTSIAPLVVVVAMPETPASDWLTYGGHTVASSNPKYPAEAPTVVVVYADDVPTYLSEWDEETPLTEADLQERGIYYEGYPAPRLTSVE
ncbi:hypothetical protein [Halocatena halophila]|uniref:hypothetical protein n=1 Tax=Halocatena halophila TaxID=2814576 RepID=UPI002ED545A6